jgi:hypothetical protein
VADASVTVVVRRGVGGVPLVRAAELLLLAETAAQHQVFPVGGLCGAGGHSGASDRLPGRGRARRGCRIGPGLGSRVVLQGGGDGLQRGGFAVQALQPDVVPAHGLARAGAECFLPLADQVQGPVVLLPQFGQEAGVGGELVTGQAGSRGRRTGGAAAGTSRWARSGRSTAA